MHLQTPWINEISDGLQVVDIETTLRVISAVSRKLEGDGKPE